MKQVLMLWLIPALILLAMPVEAEPPDNVLGLYFDTNANTTCMEWMMLGGTQTMYLILSNPTMPTIYGYECGITVSSESALLLSFQHPCGLTIDPLQLDQIRVDCPAGVPAIDHTILMSFEWLYMSTTQEEILFQLHGSVSPVQPGDQPLIKLADGSYLPVSVNEYDNVPASAVLTWYSYFCYPVSADDHSWDAVKSLYR